MVFNPNEWANKLILTIDSTKVDQDITDFPVLITLSSGTGITGFDASAVMAELEPDTISGTAVSGTYDSYTKLMLHMDGDQSDSQHIVTTAGDPQIVASGVFNGAMYFDGTGDYLSVADSSDWSFGTGNFTIDFWFNPDTSAASQTIVGQYVDGNDYWYVHFSIGSTLLFEWHSGGVIKGRYLYSWAPTYGVWYYIVFFRNGTGASLFIDGDLKILTETTSFASNDLGDVATSLKIGTLEGSSQFLEGYIDELRISKGIARTTLSGSVPIEPYTTDSSTVLLLHFDGDQSDSGHDITFNGDPQIYSSQGKFNGSYFFDGTGDYLSMSDSPDWDFGTGDFTIDLWVNFSSLSSSYGGILGQSVDASNRVILSYNGDVNTLYFNTRGGSSDMTLTASWAPSTGVWHHIAIVRNGASDWKIFINGKSQSVSGALSHTLPNLSAPFEVGRHLTGAAVQLYHYGYTDEIRISKGVARWTSNFIPPTGPYGSSWDNRKKIAVTTTVSGVETELYTEIDYWDIANDQATLWTKVPTISSGTNTTMYLYYDLTHTTNSGYIGDTGEIPAQSVWDNNFVGVWHMSQDPTSSGVFDSTSNSNDGTPNGTMTSADLVDGKIGKAIDFDGTDDYIDVGTDSTLNTTSALTYEAMYNISTTPVNLATLVCKWDQDAITFQGELHVNTDDSVASNIYNSGGGTSVNANTNSGDGGDWVDALWHYAVTTINVSTGDGKARLYMDGDLNVTSTGTIATINSIASTPTTLGERYNSATSTQMDGLFEEVRISNVDRSASWIKATYYSNFDTLITYALISVVFTFSLPDPADLSTVYGLSHTLSLTTAISGEDVPYVYDAVFFDDGNNQIGSTVSGLNSGSQATSTAPLSTPAAINYGWYVQSTSSGSTETSQTYSFTNRFLAEGYTEINGTRASGVPVRLYRRSTGVLVSGTTSAGVSGTFSIVTPYNEEHYAVAIHPTDSGTNALIYDWITP